MRKPAKIVSLASALAALATPAGLLTAPPSANSADPKVALIVSEPAGGAQSPPEPTAPSRVELMSFTVVQASDGEMFPQHGSHVSHASHVSGVGIPNLPSLPTLPTGGGYSGGPATTPAPVTAADPVATACARASAGYGVKDIVSELEQSFGLSTSDAQSIAKQALAASLNNGSYCAGSNGG